MQGASIHNELFDKGDAKSAFWKLELFKHLKFPLLPTESVYVPSSRTTPKELKHFDYPYHFEVRRVSRNSGIRWRNHWVTVSSTLAEKYIRFEEVEDGIDNIYFCELMCLDCTLPAPKH
jgi:hypothetical protein